MTSPRGCVDGPADAGSRSTTGFARTISVVARERILMVDDEASIRELVVPVLRTEGFDVDEADDGETALELFRRRPHDLVVLDLRLPGIDGLEVLREIRRVSTAYVIVLTARTEEADRVVGLELGADDYVTKPFSPRELVARVRTILRRAAKPAATGAPPLPPPLPFAVDEGRRQIRFYGQGLELSRYEYGLLKTLVEHPGHVFSRDVLLDKVWDTHSESLDRTVDAHVKTLRAKLRGDAGTAEADFYACLTWSTRKGAELPVLMVVTNNRWGISTAYETQHPSAATIADRARGFGMPAEIVDGNDVEASWAACPARSRPRSPSRATTVPAMTTWNTCCRPVTSWRPSRRRSWSWSAAWTRGPWRLRTR